MCVTSMVGDHYIHKWEPREWWPPIQPVFVPNSAPNGIPLSPVAAPAITREEFDALKREVIDMKELLKRAAKYDADNGEPQCETDSKMEVLRRVAKLVGVDIEDVIRPAQ